MSRSRSSLHKWQVRQRFGALGEHGSIAVTEHVVLTLKPEWLRRVPLIRGMEHLTALLDDLSELYSHWRGHMTLDGATPGLIHCGQQWQKPDRSAKTIPGDMERHVFADPGVTAYRLAAQVGLSIPVADKRLERATSQRTASPPDSPRSPTYRADTPALAFGTGIM